ncbi:Longin-like domain-containing protein [Spinellus fusiger]|nr:Longin-like domain-containing protein [Spinellus fusiger]
MKLYGILVLTKQNDKAQMAASFYDLASFGYFQRGSVQEFMNFTSITIAERTPAGKRQSVESEHNVAHVYSHAQGISAVVLTDKDYPSRVAFSLLNRVTDEFLTKFPGATEAVDYPELEGYVRRYQDPKEADPMMKVQNELDETTEIMRQTIDSVLKRGEKLDSLVDRSEALSSQSKMFYKTAKKTNACCVVM